MSNFYATYPFEGGSSSTGTVTSVSVVSANGIDGTVANPTTTPAITLGTTLTSGSVVFSNGTGFSQNNANFFWDNTDAFLGVGTNTPLSSLSINGNLSVGTYANSVAAPSDGMNISGEALFGVSTDPDPGDPSGPHQMVISGASFTNILEVTDSTNDNALIVYPLSTYNMQVGSRYYQSFSIICNNGDAGATFYQNYGMSIGTDYATNFYPSFVPENSLVIEGQLGVGTNTPGEVLEVVGNTKTHHIVGSTAAPTLTTSTGAGTGGSSSISGTDLGGLINVTTGTGPSANALVFQATFSVAYGSAPFICITPANAATASLAAANIYITSSTGSFSGHSNSTALTNGTAYSWFYQVVQ